jgi:hypothetical protein
VGLVAEVGARAGELLRSATRTHHRRDDASVRHHYDVGNDFYRLFLDEQMVYSCAYWAPGADRLDLAQLAKLELICRKLELRPASVSSTWAVAGERSSPTPLRCTASAPPASA